MTTTKETIERLWRCPLSGSLYARPDVCDRRCWARAGQQEKHQPVTRITTVAIVVGHEAVSHG